MNAPTLWVTLKRYWPECPAECILEPGGPEQLIIGDGGPSMEEIEAKRKELATEIRAGEYRDKRAAAYPDIGDQLDALWKSLPGLLSDGTELPAEAGRMAARIAAVKRAHPKGET